MDDATASPPPSRYELGDTTSNIGFPCGRESVPATCRLRDRPLEARGVAVRDA